MFQVQKLNYGYIVYQRYQNMERNKVVQRPINTEIIQKYYRNITEILQIANHNANVSFMLHVSY